MTPGRIGVAEFAITNLYVIIGWFFIKAFISRYPDSKLAQAFAFIVQ